MKKKDNVIPITVGRRSTECYRGLRLRVLGVRTGIQISIERAGSIVEIPRSAGTSASAASATPIDIGERRAKDADARLSTTKQVQDVWGN